MGSYSLSNLFRKAPSASEPFGVKPLEDPAPSKAEDHHEETVKHWNSDAQSHISALLGQQEEEEEEDTIDLEALRKMLAEQISQRSGSQEGYATEAILQDVDDVGFAIDDVLAPHEKSLSGTSESEGTSGPGKEQVAIMHQLLQDDVLMDLLERGMVMLPTALRAIRQQPQFPNKPLWRIVIDLTDKDQTPLMEVAAQVQGFPMAALERESLEEMAHSLFRLFPEAVRHDFFQLNLLPFKLQRHAISNQRRLLLASHDPSHPVIQQFVQSLHVPADIYFAPKEVIRKYLIDIHHLLEASELPDSFEAQPLPASNLMMEDAHILSETDTKDEAEPIDDAEDLEDTVGLQEDVEEAVVLQETEGFEETDPRDQTDHVVLSEEAAFLTEDTEFFELQWDPVEALPEVADAEESTSTVSSASYEVQGARSSAPEPLPVPPPQPMGDFSKKDSLSKELDEALARFNRRPGIAQPDHPSHGEDTDVSPPSFDGNLADHASPAPVPRVSPWADDPSKLELSIPGIKPLEEAMPATPSPEPPETIQAITPETPEETAPEASTAPVTPVLFTEEELKKIRAKDRVTGLLLSKSMVSHKQVKLALQKQGDEDIKDALWRVLTQVGGVDREAIFAEAARLYAFKSADLSLGGHDPEFARSVMNTFEESLREQLIQFRVVPYAVDLDQQSGTVKVVFITHDPTRPEIHRIMQKLKLERFELRYAPEQAVHGLIQQAFPRKNEFLERIDGDNAFDLGTSYQEHSKELVDENALEAEISRSKLINLFEATLVEAVRQDASDVHIWPNAKKQVEIHFRIDGRLRRWHLEDKVHPEALIAVIKDNSMNVDRFERDAAQDGFIQRWVDETLIRFRVSVLPIANAAQEVRSESIVIRVLDDRKVVKDLRKLGLHPTAFERFEKAINQPHGMVILTGPTGSGKTTTLYAALHMVVTPEVNVLTVEDPVEYILPGVRQIKLNNKLGLEGALRSILRHDPDIVMVGEMRDRGTAELAIKLANTGHLTFSTLHTNDAASAVTRLYKMGIEPFLIAYAINLVVAQRLIRRLCPTCKQKDPNPDAILLKRMGFSQEEISETVFYIPGEDPRCPQCKGQGYKGRRAVSEALYFSRELRHLIADSEGRLDEQHIKDLGMKQGMLTLQDSARTVVLAGETSILEMLRVISSEE